MRSTPRPSSVVTLIALLVVECGFAIVVTVLLGIELATAEADSLPSAIALLVLSIVLVAWAAAMVVSSIRGRAWVRGSALVWQVLQAVVGINALTGPDPQPGLAWPLIIVAVVAAILLFTPAVRAALVRRGDPGETA